MQHKKKNNYVKDRTVCKSCFNTNRRKNNNNTIFQNELCISNQHSKIENVNNNNKVLFIGISKCGRTYLVNYFPIQKQERIFIITQSLNQYYNIKTQISDEIQPLGDYGNSIVVFDVVHLYKQEKHY